MMQRLPSLYFAPSALGGRGVFTSAPIPEGAVLEICPVIVLPPEEVPVIHGTRLHDYYFSWGWNDDQCAIALGFGSLYNHAYEPNARYQVDIDDETLEIIAIRDIAPGEEITVSYNGDPEDKTPVWFHPDIKDLTS